MNRTESKHVGKWSRSHCRQYLLPPPLILELPPSISSARYDNSMALNAIFAQGLNPEVDRQASVRTYIDSTLTEFFNQLSLPPSQAQPSITLRCRASPTSCVFNRASGALETRQDVSLSRTYSWPGATAYESWKFSKGLATIRAEIGCMMPCTKERVLCSCDHSCTGDY